MSFLMPLFLWLFPLTLIPLLIHLFHRRNLITINFSTIQFLKLLERESIKKLRLLQILLLILRTIIVLLLILMISRPVIKGIYDTQLSATPSLHVIVLDDSFSIRGREDLLQNAVNKIIAQIPVKDHLMWVNMNSGLQFHGLKEDLPPFKKFIKGTYLGSSLTKAFRVINENINTPFTSYDLYILSDAQQEIMTSIHENTDHINLFNTYILITPPIENNYSITELNILNEILLPNDNIDIDVFVYNNGTTNNENRLLQLLINDMTVGQQLISLKPMTGKIFKFKTALSQSGMHLGLVELDVDDKEEDNQFYFIINIPEKQKVALIGKSNDEMYYVKESLNTLNKFGESLIISEYLSLDEKYLEIFNNDVVFIFNLTELTAISDSIIDEYLYNGGHIILFPNSKNNSSEYSGINNIIDISDSYNELEKYSLSNDAFQDMEMQSIQSNDLNKIFFESYGNDRNIKYFKYISLPFNPEYTQIQLKDGSPVWNRYKMQTGIIDIFGYAINLNWTNFPIKGSFLPFIHYLLYSNSINTDNLFIRTGEGLIHTLSNYYMKTIYHLQPNGKKNILIPDKDNKLKIKYFRDPGYHKFESDGYTIHKIAVNIDNDELQNNTLNIYDTKKSFPDNIDIIQMDSDFISNIKQDKIGVELWRYLLYASILLLILEMILSNAKKQN